MISDDLNQIRGVVKEEIDSALEPIKGTLADHSKKLDVLWDQTVKLTEDITEVQETLNSHTVTLKQIVTNAEHNTDNLKKLDRRVHELEDQAGIVPPPELTLTS